MTEASTVSLRRLRLEVLAAYGGKCACCGVAHVPALAIDHITPRDRTEARRGGQHALFRRLRDEGFPQGEFQVLCATCNVSKGRGAECDCRSPQTVGAALDALRPRKRPAYPTGTLVANGKPDAYDSSVDSFEVRREYLRQGGRLRETARALGTTHQNVQQHVDRADRLAPLTYQQGDAADRRAMQSFVLAQLQRVRIRVTNRPPVSPAPSPEKDPTD